MKLHSAVLIGLCFGLALSAAREQQAKSKFARRFPVVDPGENLYAADEGYVIQLEFSKEGDLSAVRAAPKHFFSDTHPEWKEPDSPVVMPLATYQGLLQRISSVRPIGKLARKGKVGIVSNLRAWFLDQYEDGVVERGMVDDSAGKPYGVASFTVTFFRTVSGKLESKDIVEYGADRQYEIRIGERWYWTSETEYQRLSMGSHVRAIAAGPINR